MKFSIVNILILESFFRRAESIDFENAYVNADNTLDIEPSAHSETPDSNIIVKLKAKLTQKFQGLTLVESEIVIVGVFKVEEGTDKKAIDNFMQINAPAIIFPYIREAFSSASVKAGLPPILLQPVNFVELAKPAKPNLVQQPEE